MLAVATAGHVDHGKSTLVRRLTGTDPDRWEEEHRRGLTIDLGFAELTLPSGRTLALIDVPGHARFVKNMVAGVGSVSACIFVVAADDGWMRQSEEHLRILGIVGADTGVVVLTKAAATDPELLELARAEVVDRLTGTGLDGAPCLAVDAVSGRGIAELEDALDHLAGELPEPPDRGRPRLWVDRSFTVAGAGTVVTGTLAAGTMRVGDAVAVIGARRRTPARVRGLQCFGREVGAAGPGSRVAINLAGIGHRDVQRGDAVVWPGRWHETARVDATLRVLADGDRPVTRRAALAAHFGSDQLPVRLQVLAGASRIEPGASGCVRLTLPRRLPLLPGDRYVLRDLGQRRTLGGGEVLDVDPMLPLRRARPDRSVERLVRERGRVDAKVLERLTGEHRAPTLGHLVTDEAWEHEVRARLAAQLHGAGPDGVDVAALDDDTRTVLAAMADVRVRYGRARWEADDLGADAEVARILRALDAAPFAPPPLEDVGVRPALLRELVQRGLVVEHDGIVFSAGAVARAGAVLAQLLAQQPAGVTVAEVREALGASRRRTMPLLAILDARGVTRRTGDRRVAGPNLPVVEG